MKRTIAIIAAALGIASANAATPAITSMQIMSPTAPVPADNTDLTARTRQVVNTSLRDMILPLDDAHARVVVSYANGQSYICMPPKAPAPGAGGAAILDVESGTFTCSRR
ncbi:MAG: hypothetical protein M0Z99_22090 [Betaproteobacteria bacterium]|nr:hypothetical protein [Betaproteobacteria bacterium]